MTLQDLKRNVKITDLVCIKENKKEFFIRAPWRDERTASVKINVLKNTFYDFGLGKGGSVIDFVCMLKGCSVAEAVRFLREYAKTQEKKAIAKVDVGKNYNNNNNNNNNNNSKSIEIKSIKELAHPALLKYVRSRKIYVSVAKKYTKEIYYVHTNKTYFAIAFENISGGYEVRNLYYKGTIGKKDISFINNNANKIVVFEGFFDFLTFATMLKAQDRKEEEFDFLVLNSVALISKAIQMLKRKKYKRICLFFDADSAGDNATKAVLAEFANAVDMRKIYKNKKDLSEFWQAVA